MAPDGTVCLIADVSEQLTSDAWANRAAALAITLGASAIHVEGFSAATTYVRLVSEALRRQRPPHHITVSSWPPKGRARVGDALARSQGMIAGLENGRCVIAGHLPDLEADMTAWQPGAHQPDRVAAAVIAFDVLSHAAGQRWTFATPVGAVAPGGGFGDRLGRPDLATLIARTRAESRQSETKADDADAAPVASVTSMAGYLSRRVDGGGYDPLRGLRVRVAET